MVFKLAWSKNGTPNTLGSAGDDCDITDLTAYKFNVFLWHKILTGSDASSTCNINNNSNSVYARRGSDNGGGDFTSTSGTNWNLQRLDTADEFVITFICSISGEEKLGITFNVSGKSGASLAPERKEQVLKFVPSPDADITRIDMNNSGGGSYDTDTNLSALGTD